MLRGVATAGAYRDAYMSLSAAAVFAPFVRLELLNWDPIFTGQAGTVNFASVVPPLLTAKRVAYTSEHQHAQLPNTSVSFPIVYSEVPSDFASPADRVTSQFKSCPVGMKVDRHLPGSDKSRQETGYRRCLTIFDTCMQPLTTSSGTSSCTTTE